MTLPPTDPRSAVSTTEQDAATPAPIRRRALLAGLGATGAAVAGVAISTPAEGAPKKGARPDWLDVTEHGAAGDGETDETPTLTDILDAIGDESATIYFPRGRYAMHSDLTLPPTVTLMMDNGAVLEPADDMTLTVEGPLAAGPHQVFGGAGRVIGRLGTGIARPEWWGAKADGHNDDAAAINAAVEAMHGAGGGTVHLSAGTYLLATVTLSPVETSNPQRFSTLIVPRSGVNLEGEGEVTVLKAADSLNAEHTWNFIYPPDPSPDDPLTDIQYRNFTVDGNGENNLDEHRARWNTIGVRFGARITIENIRFINNASRQCFFFGSNQSPQTVSDLTIRNCHVENVGRAVPGNDNQTDHSSIYAQADGCIVEGNVFINPDKDRFTAATAIECHSSNAIVANNRVENYRNGINLVASVTDQVNTTYANNLMRGVEAGVFSWCNRGRIMDRVRFTGNIIECRTATPENPHGARAIIGTNVANPITSIVFENNTFSYLGDVDVPAIYENGAIGISIGRCHNLKVSNNHIAGTIGPAIALNHPDVPLLDDLQRIEIVGNQLEDCGRDPDGDDEAHTAVLLKSARSLRLLRVEGNSIVNTGDEPTMTRGVYGTAGIVDGTIVDNVMAGTSTDISWNDGSTISRLRVEHTGSGSPEGVVRASIGGRYTDIEAGEVWDKVSGSSSVSGWMLREFAG